jgi:DNA-binding transcriptional LysR family regulator
VELRHIRCVLAVADTRHFGRAAERLFITQPALSQHIRNLERELRCQLFDRSSRRVTLTPAGAVFVDGARALLSGSDNLLEATRAAQLGETGVVAIGMDCGGDEGFLTRLLTAWASVARAVRPRLTSAGGAELIDAVHSRDIDVALVFGPAAVGWATVTPLCELPLQVVLPAAHPLAGRPAIEPAALFGERFVGLSRGLSTAVTERVAALWDASGAPFELAAELPDPSLVRVAVSAGMGVAVTVGADAGLLPSALVAIHLAGEGACVPVTAVWRPDCSIQARTFVRTAVRATAAGTRAPAFAPERPAC